MLDSEKVIKGLEKIWDAFNSMEHELYADYVFDALELLKEQEEKPLRCKNCSYHRDDDWCNEHRREVKKTDYCSFGAWNGR